MPWTSVASGVETAMALVRRSVTEGTWSAYSKVWREWETLLESVGEDGVDRETSLLYFVGDAFSRGVSPSGMSKRLSALAFWFQVRGERDVSKSFLVRRALKGFRQGRVVRDTRRPVSYDLLLDLGQQVGVLCFSEFEVCLFRLAFSLAFFWCMPDIGAGFSQ